MYFWDRFLTGAYGQRNTDAIRDIWEQRAHRARRLSTLGGHDPVPGERFVLNLDRSPDRLENFKAKALSAGFKPARYKGIDATADDFDPEPLVQWLDTPRKRRMAGRKGGSLACYMGHKGMWERFLESSHEVAAFFEDDAEPLADPLRYLSAFPPPDDWDIIFFSERTEPLGCMEDPYAPLSTAFQEHFRYPELLKGGQAPGLDGMMASRKGAARMLEILSEMGMPAAIDVLIVRNALIEPLNTGDARFDDSYRQDGGGQNCRSGGRLLEAYATTTALLEVGKQKSILKPMRKAHMAKRESVPASDKDNGE